VPIDPVTIAMGAQGLGSVLSAGGGLLTALGWDKTANRNLAFQKDAFGRTFKNQLGVQQYQRELQDTLFEREDNAVQRRVADLQAAGLSPVLAAGSAAGAGPAVSISSAKKDAPQKSPQASLMKMEALARMADISKTMAETHLLTSQAKSASVKAKVDAETVDDVISQVKNGAQIKNYEAIISAWNAYDVQELQDQIMSSDSSLTPAQVKYATALAIMKIEKAGAKFTTGSRAMQLLVPLLKLLK